MGGFAVNKDLHFVHAAQTDVAFGIDFHTWNVLECVRYGAFPALRIATYIIYHSLALVNEGGAFLCAKRKAKEQKSNNKVDVANHGFLVCHAKIMKV